VSILSITNCGAVAKRTNSDPSQFLELREHDDNTAVVLPQHPPEVFDSLRQRTLRRNERLTETIALQSHGSLNQFKVRSVELKGQWVQFIDQ